MENVDGLPGAGCPDNNKADDGLFRGGSKETGYSWMALLVDGKFTGLVCGLAALDVSSLFSCTTAARLFGVILSPDTNILFD